MGNVRRRKSRVSTSVAASACSAELASTDLVKPSTILPMESRHMQATAPQLGVGLGRAVVDLEALPRVGSVAGKA